MRLFILLFCTKLYLERDRIKTVGAENLEYWQFIISKWNVYVYSVPTYTLVDVSVI